MKFSLVVTTLNEEDSIKALLSGLDRQTKKPDEVIIVDGGSEDKTIDIITKWAKNNKNVRLMIKKGLNISEGRNLGIKESHGKIIIHTDAGCVPQEAWLGKITEPFRNPNIDIVSGFYKMTGNSPFQRCLAPYLGVVPEKLKPSSFLPSARSMAFRKNIWESIGGFSEDLERGGEDTLFNFQARRLGAYFHLEKKAVVSWEVPKYLLKAAEKFYFYSYGDGQLNIWWHPEQRISTHSLKILAIYLRFFFIVPLLILSIKFKYLFIITGGCLLLYVLLSILKNYRFVKLWQAIFWLPVIQVTSDLTVMVGFWRGNRRRISKNTK